jgi:DNA end-binding protein Ku
MALHPLWKGYLRLSLVSCLVRLYDATSTGERISFHLLNPRTRHRIRMHAVDEETGEEVPRDELVRGYEFDKGRYVIVGAEELDGLKIESSDIIDLERCVDRDSIESINFAAWYYLVPDGKVADEPFRVIQQALRNKNMAALGRLVLSAREHGVALMPHGKGMLLATLRPADEIQSDKPYFAAIATGPLDRTMVTLAERIVAQRAGKLDLREFAEDRYQAALHDLIKRKIRGEPPVAPAPTKPPSNVVNLMDALKRSVAADKRKAATSGKRMPAGARKRR